VNFLEKLSTIFHLGKPCNSSKNRYRDEEIYAQKIKQPVAPEAKKHTEEIQEIQESQRKIQK
jgi:hypothetical protein